MWRSLLLRGTTCLLQVRAPKMLHQRLLSSLSVRHFTQRLILKPFTLRVMGTDCLPVYSRISRGYKKDAKSTGEIPVSPVTVADIKQYLRSKDIPFHDGYSCLHTPSIFVYSASRKDSTSLFIDKTTGKFLCMDTLVEGSWEDLQDCLEVMQKDGQDFLSPNVLLGYPESEEEQEEKDRELLEVQRIWSSSVPFTDLNEEELQLIKTMFQVLHLHYYTRFRFYIHLVHDLFFVIYLSLFMY